MRADDLADLALADGLDEAVHDEGLADEREHAVEAHARPIEPDGRHDHAHVHGEERLADLDVGVLAQYHGQNVRAAGGGTDVEDDGGAHGRQQHRKAYVEPEVARDGLGHGKEPLEERGVPREGKRREGAPEHRPAVEEEEAQEHQDRVQDPHVDRDRERGHGGVEQDGKARGAAKGEVVGRLEEHERNGGEDEAHVEQAEERREAVGHPPL